MDGNNEGLELSLPGQPDQKPSSTPGNTSQNGDGGSTETTQAEDIFSSPAFQQALAAAVSKQVEESYRGVQAMVDSKMSTHNKKVQAAVDQVNQQIKSLEDMGVQLKPEQKNQMIENARIKAQQTTTPESPDETTPPQGQGTQGNIQAGGEDLSAEDAQKEYERIRKQYPFGIEKGDPEAQFVSQVSNREFLRTYPIALMAKAARLAAAGGGNTGSQALGGLGSGGVGVSNPIAKNNDVNDLLARGAEQLRKGQLD